MAPTPQMRMLPTHDRPRERLLREGSHALSDAELVAVLLGTGGLARAYTQGCKIAVAAARVLCMYPAVECTLSADYGFYGKLQNLLPQYGAVLLDTAFEGEVTVRFMLRQEALSPFSKALEELSAGSLAPTVQSESYYPFPEP